MGFSCVKWGRVEPAPLGCSEYKELFLSHDKCRENVAVVVTERLGLWGAGAGRAGRGTTWMGAVTMHLLRRRFWSSNSVPAAAGHNSPRAQTVPSGAQPREEASGQWADRAAGSGFEAGSISRWRLGGECSHAESGGRVPWPGCVGRHAHTERVGSQGQ